ncbi:hypothetical protein ISF_02781 [Cordyceps fumosorosea ARSEF 2679]|uniref:Uncharacterized protein n=1 Tax=Cordyceps fumosorosea (strain ARSEF 2679) TaxID=1081104 RepID=A0A168B250_CORFA|nr:hypothetical protein ISF_02781 [Cordyceps fumosorosea ARSEF 2679]OAA69511.1 hypothetical protein ISF_02781 [Cordyceps fumosorosea ARSEF 2679]
MAHDSGWIQWALILVMTALLLSLAVLAQTASVYSAAYVAAPREMAALIDTVDFSIEENESYDKDMAKVTRLEDKIRLGRLLREIQKAGDDLREDLSALLLPAERVTAGASTSAAMRASTRLLWAAKRTPLEDRVRRLDLLRMRFLVVFLGIITSVADRQPPPPPPLPPAALPRDLEKSLTAFAATPCKPALRKSLTESIPKRPPVRRLTMQAIGHQETMATTGRQGWAGVVEELQLSPRMHQRHASIERSMSVERGMSPRDRAS